MVSSWPVLVSMEWYQSGTLTTDLSLEGQLDEDFHNYSQNF